MNYKHICQTVCHIPHPVSFHYCLCVHKLASPQSMSICGQVTIKTGKYEVQILQPQMPSRASNSSKPQTLVPEHPSRRVVTGFTLNRCVNTIY